MKIVVAVAIALAVGFFLFRSEPVEQEIDRSMEVSRAVDAPEQVARKNYLKSPIDRTRAVVEQANASRADDAF